MSAAEASRSVLIIGVGNPWRCDDRVGLVVANRLQPLVPKTVRVIEHEGQGADLIFLWEHWSRVIIVDAARSGARPGTIHRFDVSKTAFPTGIFNRSSHSFGVAEAIAIGRAIHRLPEQLIVYGIEGAVYDYGDALSAPVVAATEVAVEKLLAECDSIGSKMRLA